MNISIEIEKLLIYAVNNELISPLDVTFTRNKIMDLLKVEEPFSGVIENQNFDTPLEILNNILDYCYEHKLIEENTPIYRDLMDSKIMGIFIDRPSNIINNFNALKVKSPKLATDYFYSLCIKSNYIRMNRIKKNIEFTGNTDIADFKITINMSKPELDQKEVEKMKLSKKASYPKCMLCAENVGYAGRINHPARQNHRVIPFNVGSDIWNFQYSPYVYYNEHCILFSNEHRPMKVNRSTFETLFDFVDQIPHYFIGANAGMPIIGGSILSHDHFQGGNEDFPIECAEDEVKLKNKEFEDVEISIIKWPIGTVRLVSKNRENLIELSTKLLKEWQNYKDETLGIIPFTKTEDSITPHNGITPLVRINDKGQYVVHLAFRNNRTSKNHPEGIFHPHENLHHIKKEGIGVIEVMGQAILPARLNKSFESIKNILIKTEAEFNENIKNIETELEPHMEWIKQLINKYGFEVNSNEADNIIKKEIADIYLQILTDAGVFKYTKEGISGFKRFLSTLGIA